MSVSVLAIVLVAVVVALVGAGVVRALFDRVTVYEFERALRYDRGRYVRLLGPGQHWIYRRRSTLRKVDVRPSFISVPGAGSAHLARRDAADQPGGRIRARRPGPGDQRHRGLRHGVLPDAAARAPAERAQGGGGRAARQPRAGRRATARAVA